MDGGQGCQAGCEEGGTGAPPVHSCDRFLWPELQVAEFLQLGGLCPAQGRGAHLTGKAETVGKSHNFRLAVLSFVNGLPGTTLSGFPSQG